MNIILSVVVSIMSFGAVPDDTTVNNAPAINRAIEDCAAKGGGVVTVPGGTFTSGSIFLKSGVTLKLESGSAIKGSSRVEDYSPLVTSADLSRYDTGQGTRNSNCASDPVWSQALVFGVGIERAGIEGPGTIDGNNVRNPMGEESMRGPHGILFADCRNIKFEGFKVRNASNYAFLGYEMENSTFADLVIEGGWDGIHLRGVRNISVKDCDISTGDDAFGGGYWDRMRVEHCRMNSSCNGVRLLQPSTDVVFNDCEVYGPGKFNHITSHRTATIAAFNIEPGAWGKAPGLVDRITIKNCNVSKVLTVLSVTMYDETHLGSIALKNIKAAGVTDHALSVKSRGSAASDRVLLRNCDFEFQGVIDPDPAKRSTNEWKAFPSWGMFFGNVELVKARNVKLRLIGEDYREAVITESVGAISGEIDIVK